jgi:AcrR family transcriptional regulator
MLNNMGRPRGDTRERLVRAAFEALRTMGYAGASSRTIGRIADVNPALVFYYFESVDDLLVTALAESSAERLERFRGVVENARSISELAATLGEIYRDDLASGHVTVVSELVGASVRRQALAERVTALMIPWIDLAEQAVERVLGASPIAESISARSLARAAVTFYLGTNLLTHLRPEHADVGTLLDDAIRLAPLLDVLVEARPVDT